MTAVMTAAQLARAIADVTALIAAENVTATIKRRTQSSSEPFYGPLEGTETTIGSTAISFVQAKEIDYTLRGGDAAAAIPASASVLEQDIMVVGGLRYRVVDVLPQNCFGAVTHQVLVLVKERVHA